MADDVNEAIKKVFSVLGNLKSYWFPACYIYTQGKMLEWERLKSKKFCEKMCILFGVSDVEELKKVIAKCTYDWEMCYRGSFDSAPAILNYIEIEDIGSIN